MPAYADKDKETDFVSLQDVRSHLQMLERLPILYTSAYNNAGI
jgi:hypothetical protein